MTENMERFTARGEYEELKEKAAALMILIKSHVQMLHISMPVPQLDFDVSRLRPEEAEVLAVRISQMKGELNTLLVKMKSIADKWGFKKVQP